jgi:hypothetical protein
MSKIKVNSIEASTGSTITIPSGQTLDISATTLTLPSTVVTTTGTQTLTNKTIGVSQLTGTLPVANGGTGLTTLGSATQVLRVNSGATALEFATPVAAGFTLGSPAATTSGSSVTYTGIASGTKMIIMSLAGVSINGGNHIRFQLGTSGGLTTSGYISTSGNFEGGGGGTLSDTSGFGLKFDDGSRLASGQAFFTLQNSSTNTWVYSFIGKHDGNLILFAGGNVSLSGVCDRISIIAVSNTLDDGAVNIMTI